MADRENVQIDLDTRIFYLHDDVDNNTIGKICFNLLKIIHADEKNESSYTDYKRKPVHMYINTDGGHLYDEWSLINIMLSSKTPIYTYCNGYAFSAGLGIFIAGHKRFAYNHAKFMYHNLSCQEAGSFQDLVEQTKINENLNREQIEYFIKRTKFTEEMLHNIQMQKKDFYFDANDAINYNVCDEIIS